MIFTFSATVGIKDTAMSGIKARKWVIKSHFCGWPKREDLEIVEEELPALKDEGWSIILCAVTQNYHIIQ